MSDSTERNDIWNIVSIVAIVLALAAIGLSGSSWWSSTQDELNNHVDSANKRLEALEKQMANLTNRSKIERAVTNHTISLLSGETEELKGDYMKLLSETKALNKTINYTTSATVQRALDALNNVKETQRVIQKRLQALSHLNDTAEDYLNLREEIKNLTTHVNQNITLLEEKINENRREWQKALENKTSEIDLNISDLEKRLDQEEFENTQNRTNITSNATGVPRLRKASYLMFYTIIFLATLGVIVHV